MGARTDTAAPRQLRLRVEKRLHDCGIDLWERVTTDSPLFLRVPFLQAFEEAMPDTLSPRYGVLSEDDAPVAVLVGQILTLHADRIAAASRDGSRPGILESVAARLQARVFLWGNFMGWGYSGIAFAPGADKQALWPRVAQALDRAHEADDGIDSAGMQLVMDISRDESAGASHLEKYRFRAMSAEPDMILTLPPDWRTFDDYRMALKSKYRKASVEMDRQLTAGGCVIEKLADVAAHAGELSDLHLQVHEQSVNRFVTLKREFIPALARRLGDRFLCTVVRRQSRILGFVTTLIDGDTALAYVVGHDVAENRELPIYLRLLQTAIEDGIRHGCRRVTYGRTALEPKARLGAVAVPLTVYGRHTNPIVGPLVTRLLQRVAPTQGPPLRSPFKDPGGEAQRD
jgi:hypothetical protein